MRRGFGVVATYDTVVAAVSRCRFFNNVNNTPLATSGGQFEFLGQNLLFAVFRVANGDFAALD